MVNTQVLVQPLNSKLPTSKLFFTMPWHRLSTFVNISCRTFLFFLASNCLNAEKTIAFLSQNGFNDSSCQSFPDGSDDYYSDRKSGPFFRGSVHAGSIGECVTFRRIVSILLDRTQLFHRRNNGSFGSQSENSERQESGSKFLKMLDYL